MYGRNAEGYIKQIDVDLDCVKAEIDYYDVPNIEIIYSVAKKYNCNYLVMKKEKVNIDTISAEKYNLSTYGYVQVGETLNYTLLYNKNIDSVK
jgi:hypothetical protein